jgi:hypothetical protein
LRASCGSTVAAHSFDYGKTGMLQAAASARVARTYKTYPAGNRLETARIVAFAPFGASS